MYTPEGNIWLCAIPLDISNNNQITFGSKEEQFSYFSGNCSSNITNYTYVRKDSAILVEGVVDNYVNINYVIYQNRHFSNKYFYAYVTKVEYVNEKTTQLNLKTDVFQTWQFDITYHKSFIERQTPKEDYYNTLSDSCAHGQLVADITQDINFDGGYFVFCSCDITQDDTRESASHSFSIGNYSVPCWVLYWNKSEHEAMSRTLQLISGKGWGDRILSAVYVPFLGDVSVINTTDYASSSVGTIHIVDSITEATLKKTVTLDMSQYSKQFKKELTYPYSVVKVIDKCTGQSIELSPEKFYSDTEIKFEIQGSISESPYYRITPMYYEGQERAYNHSLVIRCNTSLTISNSLYAKYMMQNGEINDLSKLFAGINGALGIASSGGLGALSSGLSTFESISMISARENQAAKLGNQVNSVQDGAMERICFQNGINISLYTTDTTHKDMIRNYWNMYGYPVNKIDNPNINGNRFNYVKMINANITGDINQEDLKEIQNIFNSGVTLWHDPDDFLNY